MEQGDRLRLGVRGIGVVLFGAGLVALGVVMPAQGPFLVGAGFVGLYGLLVAYHLLWRRVSSTLLRGMAALVAGVLVAGVVVAVPVGVRVVQEHGSTRWRAEIPSRWVDVVPMGDRIYLYEDLHGFRVLDRSSGEELFAVGAVKVTGRVARDGSMVLSGKESAEYYGADGKRRWKLDGKAWALVTGNAPTSSGVVAVAAEDGVVVFEIIEEHGVRHVGVGPDGKVRWQRVAREEVWASRQLPYGDAGIPAPLPSTVVVRTSDRTDAEVVTIDGADGTELDRRPAREGGVVGLVGDLVVFGGADDTGCAFTGVRAGRQVWHATGVPCKHGSRPSMLVLEHRVYASIDDDVSVTVDLRTGRWRRIAPVALSHSSHSKHKIGLAGDDVIVYRDGRKLTGVDAGDGTRLWTYEAPGDYTPGVDVGSDAVVVFGPPEGRNPMVSAEVREEGYLVSVLDARTGETTGTTVLPDDGLATSGPLPGGAALVVTTEETEARYVGRAPRD